MIDHTVPKTTASVYRLMGRQRLQKIPDRTGEKSFTLVAALAMLRPQALLRRRNCLLSAPDCGEYGFSSRRKTGARRASEIPVSAGRQALGGGGLDYNQK